MKKRNGFRSLLLCLILLVIAGGLLSACGTKEDESRPGDTLFQYSIADGMAMSEDEKAEFYQITDEFYDNIGASPYRAQATFWEEVAKIYGQLLAGESEIVNAKGGLMLLASENCNAHGGFDNPQGYDAYYEEFLQLTLLGKEEILAMTAADYIALPVDQRVAAVLAFNKFQKFHDTSAFTAFMGGQTTATIIYQTMEMDRMFDGQIDDEYMLREPASFAALLATYEGMDQDDIAKLIGPVYGEVYGGDEETFTYLPGAYYAEKPIGGSLYLDDAGGFSIYEEHGDLLAEGTIEVDLDGDGVLVNEEGLNEGIFFRDESHFVSNTDNMLYSHESVFEGYDDAGNTGIAFNDYGTTSGNLNNIGMVAAADGWTYFHTLDLDNNTGVLYRASVSGEEEMLYDGVHAYLHVDGEWLYYVAYHDDSSIRRIRADGSGGETLLVKGEVSAMSISDGEIFYADRYMNEIWKLNLETMETTLLKKAYPTHLYATDGWLYYIDSTDGYFLCRMRTDGSEDQQLTGEDVQVEDMNVVDGWIYYRDNYMGSTLQRMDLEGGNQERVTDEPTMEVNVAGDYIYYAKGSGGELYRMNIYNGAESKLYDGVPESINVGETELIIFTNVEEDHDYIMKTLRFRMDEFA